MKKKISLIILCGIILFGVCGCRNKDNDVDNNAPTPIRELKCNALNNVKYSLGDYFLTNDNDLYTLSISQLYSNDENCKKLNTNEKIIKLLEGTDSYYVLDNNNIKYLIARDELFNCMEINCPYHDIANSSKVFEDNDIITQIGIYVIKNDGKLYKSKNNNELDVVKEFENEKILEFGNYGVITIKYETYTLDTPGAYIKTNKAFYTSTITNKECLKYADIECKYDFKKDEELTSKYNDIVIIKNNSYITKDGKQYTSHK